MITVPALAADTDTLAAALAYAGHGWYVLPVKAGTKDPGSVVGGKWQDKSSRDPQLIAAWFAGTSHGIALHCGRSGAVVFDVDEPLKMPSILAQAAIDGAAPHQSTRSNHPGRGHYIFQQPPGRRIGNSNGQLGKEWGEVRGTNGVIVTFPSTHEKASEGGQYEWLQTGQVPELPATVAELLHDSGDQIDAASDATVKAFLEQHTGNSKPRFLDHIAERFTSETRQGASRHQTAVELACWAFKSARAGWIPARAAMERLEQLFLDAVTKDGHGKQGVARGPGMARSEWMGISAYAVGAATAENIEEFQARTKEWSDETTLTPIDMGAAPPVTIDECHAVFRRWLGAEYDLDTVNAVLAAAACERLDGDPLWLLVISGPGNAKTETVQTLRGAGAYVTSTIASEAALLSGTPKHERSTNATGGLLRKIGPRGILVIKDVTSIISSNRDARATTLAALREVYDGYWTREVGSEGGLTLTWTGRLVVVGAVTTAWDQAHSVIAAMGDRFVLIRADSSKGRMAAGRQALANTGNETAMRAELAEVVGGLVASIDPSAQIDLSGDESERILLAADAVTLARTGVEYDYQGNVIDAHAPESPTRFAKQLQQLVRGAVACGLDRAEAMELAIRCARDSMNPLRMAIMLDLTEHPGATTADVRRRLGKPPMTVRRQLDALQMLGVLDTTDGDTVAGKTVYHWTPTNRIDLDVLGCATSL